MSIVDLLGNPIAVGDLLMYAGSDAMPGISEVTKLTETRCYFPSAFFGRHFSYEKNSFRSPDKVVSLTALGINDQEKIKILYKSSVEHTDMAGTDLAVGMDVVFASDHYLCKGIINKITPKMCVIAYGESVIRTYPSYVLAYDAK